MALVNRPVQTKSELFEAYIEERFARYESEHGKLLYNRRDTRKYLERLAGELKAENQTTFLIEMMQPSWLQTVTQQLSYGLIYGLIGELMGGASRKMTPVAPLYLKPSQIFSIKPVEILEFSLARIARKNFLEKQIGCLIFGLIGGLIEGLREGLIYGLVFGLIFGLVGGLIVGLIVGLQSLKSDITIRIKPNQGMLASAKNSLVLTIFGLLLAGGLNLSLTALLPKVVSDPSQIKAIIS